MRDEIKVHVLKKPGRKILYMRYVDPLTGKQVTRSTGKTKAKDAERAAGVWQDELREGRYKSPSRVTWTEFRERYQSDVLTGLADSTFSKSLAVFSSIEKLTPVDRLAKLTADRLSQWQTKLREDGKAEATIKSYSAQLKAALRWANRIGLLHTVPSIGMPKRAKGSKAMKGRPITTEEFERMLAKVHDTVGTERSASWEKLLRGLWWSGLRLGEALALTWDGNGIAVDLGGRRPMLRIPAECHKSKRDTQLPIAPEFAELLLAVPSSERTGFVFDPAKSKPGGRYADPREAGRTITAIGKKAGVKVSDDGQGLKYASAHDLRRAFGKRWSQRIMPADLQLLMRHETIETTMAFYVGQSASETADRLYLALGDTLGDTSLTAVQDDNRQPVESQ